MADKKKPETKNYKLTGSKHTGALDTETGERKKYQTGDMVPLTEAQAKSFADKFEVMPENKGLAKGEAPHTPEQPSSPGDGSQTVKSAPNAPETKPQDSGTGAGAAVQSSNKEKVDEGSGSKQTTSAGSSVPGNTANKT